MSGPSVLCLGLVVADIFVPPLERLPAAGELVATSGLLVQPGGCAANVALGLCALGVPAAVSGRVGEDTFGELLVGDLSRHGVDTSGVVRAPGEHTSTTVILPVTGEDRRYIHTFGANAAFSVDDVPADLLAAASVIYIGGYLMLPALKQQPLVAAIKQARARGATVVLDVAVPAGIEAPLPELESLLWLSDYFVPNVDEARAITGEADPRRQADRLMACGAQRVLIKLGERGTYVRSPGYSFEMPAPVVNAVEPSGAGDAFAAGLIVGMQEGWGIERMVSFANVTGASACTALGSWNGVFSRDQTDDFLRHNPMTAKASAVA